MKKSTLALLLIAALTVCACILPPVNNNTTQPSTNDVKYINVQLADGIKQQKFVVMNEDGMYLTNLSCVVGGTERIREVLNLLLPDLSDDQFVADDIFLLLTNTIRGEMTGATVVNIGNSKNTDSIEALSFSCRGGTLIYDSTSSYYLPNEGIHYIKIEQKNEILYLTQNQYEILYNSNLFASVTKYDDLTETSEYQNELYDPFIRYTTWDGVQVSVLKD